MIFHVLYDLLDVRLHALNFPVLVRMERLLRLYIVLLLVLTLLLRWLHCSTAHIRILVRLIVLLLEEIWSIAEFFETGCSIVVLEVVVDVDEREIRHAGAV